MKKVLTFFIFICLTTVIFSGCSSNRIPAQAISNSSYSKVIFSINPLKEIADEIGNGKMSFNAFVPQGVEIHDYDPKMSDIVALKDYDVFIYNGLDMEPWFDKVMESSPKKLNQYDLSDGYDVINVNGVLDPHVWMGLTGAIYYGEKIKDILVNEYPDDKQVFETNFQNFKDKCNGLLAKYRDLFSKLDNKNLVTAHAAFNYLARDFGLSAHASEDIFSSGEPNPKTLSDLVNYCKKNNVKVIFGEEMVSKEVTDTLAREVGAEVLMIDTLEYEKEGSYLSRMESNLQLIYDALNKN